MKFFLVILVCAVFIGSQAYVIREEDPDSRLVQLNKQLEELLNDFTKELNEKVDLIVSSELSHQLLDHIHHGFSKVSKRLRTLEHKLPAEVKQAFDAVLGVSWGLGEKALHTLYGLKEKVSPVSQELSEKLYSILAPYANMVLEKVGPYTETLWRTLRTVKKEGLNLKLMQQLEELMGQLNPSVQKLQNQLQELQANLVDPVADQAQEKFQYGMEEIKQTLQPYVAPILKALQEYIKDIKECLDSPSTS